MYWCRTWSLWTIAVTLLARHSSCHTSQWVLFKTIEDNSQLAFFRVFNAWKQRNKLSVKWKTFAIHKLVCWYFRVEWVSGLKGRPYSITERRVPELIPLLGSQPTGNVSHKPGSRLPLLWAKPAVTPQLLRGLLPILLFGEQRHNGCKQFT